VRLAGRGIARSTPPCNRRIGRRWDHTYGIGGGQCGDDGYNHTAELGLGVSALDRPRSIVIFGAELREHDVTRVRQAETRFRYRQDSTVQTPLSTSVVTERIHPTWTTLRAGLELPWP